jgi:PAS domain S-box-containing protein
MKTILIVDDILENLYLLRLILEQAGYAVIEAKDGKEGLEKLHKNKVDLIISDILMPVMDGYMFCRACKKEDLFKEIPFIFYTSTYTEKLDEDFGLKLGAAHFLTKPTDPDKIPQIVKGLLTKVKSQAKPVQEAKITSKEVLTLYTKRIINKLEKRNLDLQNEILVRKKVELALINENEILDLISANTSLKKIFNHIIFNLESLYPDYKGSISLLQEDGIHLDLVSAPSMPKPYNLAIKRVVIGKNVGSCGTAAFIKKSVIVSDISTDALWKDYKDIALKHNLKSCWSIPIFSKQNKVLGTFAIYSNAIKTPSFKEIQELNAAVRLVKIAIVKFNIMVEVKKRDASYKSLINQASDAIMTYSIDGTIHNFNKSAYKNLGYTQKEFLKLNVKDLIVGDLMISQDPHDEIFKGEAVIFERQFKHKNGSLIEAEISAKLQKDGKVLGIARDITEWKKNVNEIKLAKEFSSGLLNAMSEGLVVGNVDGKIISVNPSFCEITGFSEAELIGETNPYPFLPPENRKEDTERFKLLQEAELENGFETTYMHKNGTRFPVHILVSVLYDFNGNKTAQFATVQDITKRKKAELDLKLAKEFTDKLVMSMQEGLIISSINGEIMLVNDSAASILGYSKEELVGLNMPYPFVKLENLEVIPKAFKRVEQGETLSFKFEFIRKNTEKILTSFLTGNVKNNKGEVIALFATIKDVSEEEKAKILLQENAAKSNQKKNVILELASLVGTDYKKALKKITTLSAETLNVTRVGVWKFNDAKNEIECEKLVDLKKQNFESGAVRYGKENPDYFEAIFSNQMIVIEDAIKNKITKNFAEKHLLPLGITSMLDVVIHVSNELYGVLCFEHVGPKRVWSKEEEEFATTIANLVSLMVESTERKVAEDSLVLANTELSKANTELNVLRNQLEQENLYLRDELDLVFNYEEMVYGSEAFSNVLSEVEKVAPTTATVLLLGESGTGKELLARALHNISLRNNKPLIKVNCSAIPRELMESEFFGHKKGSFTGAISDKIGKFELADGGTLFLDEIGDLPIDMQPKILRFLQEGEIEVVGGTQLKKLDVRVIAATNLNLIEKIKKKKFREDLYFRLNVFPILVPPLRKRKADIPLLVEHFIDKFNKAYGKGIKYIADDTMRQLKAYEWPGNIRELENLIERASILSNTETLIIPGFESLAQKTNQPINNKDLSLDTAQRKHILQVLEQCDWKISGANGASKLLDLKPSTLRDKMHKLDLKKPITN